MRKGLKAQRNNFWQNKVSSFHS